MCMKDWCKVCFWYDVCKDRQQPCERFALSSEVHDYFEMNTKDLGNLQELANRLSEVRRDAIGGKNDRTE